MVEITLNVDGMACGMCESHVNDAIRNAFEVKKVTSSHKKGETQIITDLPIDEEKLKEVVGATGYTVTGIKTNAYEKKKFSLFGK